MSAFLNHAITVGDVLFYSAATAASILIAAVVLFLFILMVKS